MTDAGGLTRRSVLAAAAAVLTAAKAAFPSVAHATAAGGAGRHRLGVCRIGTAEADVLRTLGRRLSGSMEPLSRAALPAGLDRIVVSLRPLGAPAGDVLAVTYTLGDTPDLPALLKGLAGVGADEAKVLRRLSDGPAVEQLFGWQDDDIARDSPDQHIGTLTAIPLDDASAATMRDLVRELNAKHVEGLAARARVVGYFREAMALVREDSGQWLYLVYLELRDLEMRKRLLAYPETPFTSWWSSRFTALVPNPVLAAAWQQSKPVISWRREDAS
ncbi:MAG TPA: hypothetical protein VJR87_05915 [Allosphingosinicella sp.]|nr:hypothetical protein [Allosphingosinicella sp.]